MNFFRMASMSLILVVAGLNNTSYGQGCTTNYVAKIISSSCTLSNSSIFDNGNVGVGTTTPGAKFVVNGKSRFLNTLTLGDDADGPSFNQLVIRNNTPEMGYYELDQAVDEKFWITIANSKQWSLIAENDAFTATQSAFVVTRGTGINISTVVFPNGSVGIGTSSTGTAKLAVNGKIEGTEVVVQATVPDYVFESDYRLTPLTELEKSITQMKHLPGLPSAKEVEKNGLELGDVSCKLLKKIEELTLYVIDLKKENESLNRRLSTIER